MEFMRRAAKTWVAKLLMALLVLSFGVWGIKDVSTSFLGDILSWSGFGPKDLVHVGGRTIRQPEYNAALQRTLRNVSQQSGQNLTIDDARRMGLDKNVLDNLIATASLDAQAQKLGLALGDDTVLKSISENKLFQDATGKFDGNLFKRVLEQNNFSEADFLSAEKQGRLRSFITATVDAPVKLPKVLSLALAQYRGETRDVKYFDFTVNETDLPSVTDVELKKQYEAAPAAYTAPEYRSVAIMKVDPADIADRVKVSDEELKAGFERYKVDYFTPEKRTIIQVSFPTLEAAAAAKVRISAGEDIMKIASDMKLKDSDVTLADRQRGDFLDSKIGDAAFKLPLGAVSDPVAGDLATVILKAASISAEKQSTLDDVKNQLKTRLQLEKAKEEITAIFTTVEDARSQQIPFEKIAETSALPFKLVSAVSGTGQDKTGADVDMPAKEQVLKAAFATDVGNSDDALPVGDGYVWYEVREITPPGLKLFDAVKVDVTKDVVAAKLRELAASKAKAFLADGKSGASLESLAGKTNAVVKTASGLKRNETSQEFDGAAVVALYGVGDQGFAWSLAGDGKTARVMQVSKVTLPAIMATSPDISKLQADASSGLARDLQDSFVNSLRKAAKVTINEELWKQNSGTVLDEP